MTLVKWKRPSENGQSNSPMIFNSPLSNLFESFFNDDFFVREYASFVPSVNVSEEKDKFNIELSAPGFNKSDFKLEVEKGVLTISGKHETAKETAEKNYTRKEFNYGSFQRSFTLPENVNEDNISAKYENGILKIELNKKEKEAEKTAKQILIS